MLQVSLRSIPTGISLFLLYSMAHLFLPGFCTGQYLQQKFGRLTIEDGLSNFRVYDVLQDTRGFLWIATLDGLNRYDGYEFKIYRHDGHDSTSLSDNTATALCEDRTGNLWIGSRDGALDRFERKSERFLPYRFSSSRAGSTNSSPINSLFIDRSGDLWICTQGEGVSRLRSSLLNSSNGDSVTFDHFADRKSTRLNSSHIQKSRMPSSA